MNRPYTWTRTRALLLALRDAWRFRHRYCKTIDWNVTPRAFCVKDRDHGGPHVDRDGHSWANHDDRPLVAGHTYVPAPEAVYCPCAGECHDHRTPCSPSCIVHRLREMRR